jgi:hypothetical protein
MAAGPITNKVISSRKPKASTKLTKGTAPPAVTKKEGTYYRAINVWFDERNRNEIMNMGKSPNYRGSRLTTVSKQENLRQTCHSLSRHVGGE